VAWATERKDVLSAFFCMLTLWAYYGYTRNKTVKGYALALVLYSLGLMSKPMVVTLPFILFLMDFWPLGRLGLRGKRPSAGGKPRSSVVSLVLEKLPFLGLALVCTLVVSFLHRAHPFVGFDERPLPLRIANALVSYVVYLRQTVWPVDLAVYYHFPESVPAWEVAGLLCSWPLFP